MNVCDAILNIDNPDYHKLILWFSSLNKTVKSYV